MSPQTDNSIEIQEKVWNLVPKNELVPGQEFINGKGMRGRRPVITFKNGSRIEFRTWGNNPGKGDAAAMANSGGTLDHVLIDELCPRRLYEELKKRVARRNGTIRLTATPINAPSLAEWVREECRLGNIRDLHYRCEPRYCIPEGASEPLKDPTGRPMDAAWIADLISKTDPNEIGVVVHGEWQVVHADRTFGAWSDSLIFGDDLLPAPKALGLGIDYGEGPGRLVVELLLWAKGPNPDVWVLGEWTGKGTETPEEIARGIKDLVASRKPYNLGHVSRIVGDVNSAGPLAGGRSMNEVVSAALGRGPEGIETAWKTRGSVEDRFHLLNFAMARRRLRVHESCVRLIESFRTHRRKAQNAAYLKDPIDAVWYVGAEWLQEMLPTPERIRIA